MAVAVAGLLSAAVFAQSVDRVGTPEAGLPGVVMSMSQITNAQVIANISPVARPLILKPVFRLTGKQDGPALAGGATSVQERDLKRSDTRKAQSLATSFLGATYNDGALFPPDSMGAVGPTQFIVAINNRFRSFSKTTGSPDGIMDVAPDVFFAPAKTPLGGGVTFNFTSDPKIRYDGLSKRWYIIMIDVPNGGSLPNRLMIAVSDTDVISPSTLWTFFYTAVPAGRFLDYPTLGIDANALYIGGNMFSTSTSSFLNCDVWVVRKSSIVGSGPIVSTYFANIENATDGAFTPQGVDDPDGTLGAGYFVGVDWITFNKLVFNRVTNPGTTPVLSANIPLVVPTTRFPGTVPHLGNTGGTNGNLDALDDRLFSAQARAGQIWTSHNILVDTAGNATGTAAVGRNGVRWYQIGNIGGTPTLTQSGTVFDNNATLANARWFSIPSIAVSGQGHAAVGFTSAGAAFRANASFAGRLAGAAAGTMDPVADITATTAAYNPPGDPGGAGGRRWGDYSFTSVDPADNMTMWTIQEYASSTNIWGVQVAKLLAPPPAAITSISPSTVDSGLNSVVLTITGTPAAGSAFYDPGAAFANRLKVDIPGITINSVTSVSATQVVVNVSTLGSAAGAKTITVINPDGQTVSAGGLLSVNGGAVAPVITSADSTVCAVGVACNFSITTAGTPAPTITVTGVLPSGVSVTGGVFSGTPAVATQGTYPLTVSASNASGTYNQPFTLIVTAACGGFTDVAPSDIFCNSSEWLKNRGVTLGCTSSTLYCPTQTVTRAQMSLFMQRLGDALQPVVSAIQLQPGALDLSVTPVVCQTTDVAPANYPRVAIVNWSFAGEATGPLTARGFSQASVNGGVTWPISVDINFMRTTASQAGNWANMTGLSTYTIPAGQTTRFAIRLDRQAGSGPGNFGVTRCHMQTTISSQTGTSSPYDAYFGPRDN
jgi:hypothetical protein